MIGADGVAVEYAVRRRAARSGSKERITRMGHHVAFTGVFPIGTTDPAALPVRELGPAIGYYTQVLGFTLTQKTERTARFQRDAVQIGVAVSGQDPEQASCYFAVSDVAALRAEYAGKGIDPTEMQREEHDGRPLLVFFAKEPYGVCFCFGQPVAPSGDHSE